MHLTDKITLSAIAKKYNVRSCDVVPAIDQIFGAAEHITNEDMRTLGEILSRLPEKDIQICIEHNRFNDVVRRFCEVANMPDRQAMAFLKLGVPISNIVLPELAREALNVILYRKKRLLYVNGTPTRLRNVNGAQLRVLAQTEVPPE